MRNKHRMAVNVMPSKRRESPIEVFKQICTFLETTNWSLSPLLASYIARFSPTGPRGVMKPFCALAGEAECVVLSTAQPLHMHLLPVGALYIIGTFSSAELRALAPFDMHGLVNYFIAFLRATLKAQDTLYELAAGTALSLPEPFAAVAPGACNAAPAWPATLCVGCRSAFACALGTACMVCPA